MLKVLDPNMGSEQPIVKSFGLVLPILMVMSINLGDAVSAGSE